MSFIIIDYSVGNVKSLLNAFSQYCNVIISKDKDIISNAEAIILPGVGSFKTAMKSINESDIKTTLLEYEKRNKFILGICLGMQILFENSEESPGIEGLGFIKGNIKKLEEKKFYKIPNIGWEKVYIQNQNLLIQEERNMYFCHSYVANIKDDIDILTYSKHGNEKFCSSLNKNNIYGCQFHPEKSGKKGLTIIQNYVNLVRNEK